MEGTMNTSSRGRLVMGVLLVLIGLVFLALQFSPELAQWFQLNLSWPLIVVGVGGLLLIIGLLTGEPGMAIPACIVAGIGGILYYQNSTEDWTSWAYAWALIPGFVGVGMVLAGILGSKEYHIFRRGFSLMLISLVLFILLGSFFGAFNFLGVYWPLLVVAAGILIIIRAFFPRR
jgi:hypothetical protein